MGPRGVLCAEEGKERVFGIFKVPGWSGVWITGPWCKQIKTPKKTRLVK